MFLKPYKVKSNAPLKSSDTKRLRQQLETAFPNATPEQFQVFLPAKANVSVLKLVAHSNFQTSVFCVDKLPMFFETEGGTLAPTLYAIWQLPELLPYFTTIPAVLPKLSNGADLMLPGVVAQGTGMNIYGRYKSGQLVAVNLTSNQAAVGIGYLPRSSDDLYMCGGHGSAVKMLHIFGDKLWGHEPILVQQVPNQKPNDLTKDDFPALGLEAKEKVKPQLITEPKSMAQKVAYQKPNHMTKEDFPALGMEVKRKEKPQAMSEPKPLAGNVVQKGTEQSNEEPTDILLSSETSYSECDKPLSAQNDAESSPTEVSPEELLKNAFLAALKNHGKTLQLPLLTSNFFRLYVVPEALQPIDLKKTKYKKLSNFLAQMIDEGFIVVREETKGVDKITSIDFEHPELVNFITDFKRPSAKDANEPESPLFHSELTELYVVTDATAAFFTQMNYKRGEGIPAAQIKKIVRGYISKQNLPVADAATKSVRLDEMLQQFCNCTAAPLSTICNAILLKMEHSYQMCSVRDVTSNKPLIQMSLATRSGNKKVTLVSNVECYGIILPEFIKLCKQGAAASTTVVKLPSQKHELLQIQGNQVRFIHTLLTETYKVPPKCILGLELAKDGKKHKKK